MRRQLTLFLPPEPRARVEPIRRRLDPRQHALIPAHVTLCREDELTPWDAIERRLDQLGAFSITLRFGEPTVLPDGCVLLRPPAGIERYQQLRQAILGPTARDHGAHLTLLHPRNAVGVTYDLSAIASELDGLEATFRVVTLIEQEGSGPWLVKQEYGVDGSQGPPATGDPAPGSRFEPRQG